jgi:hypothetical protein
MDPATVSEQGAVTQAPSKRPTPRDWVIAATTGLLLIGVAFLGADKPPPPGFVVVVLMAGVLAGLVAFALPRWRATKALPQCGKLRSPAVQGAVVGLAMWGIALLLPFSSEPTITLGLIDYAIGAAMAASFGAAGAAILARLA